MSTANSIASRQNQQRVDSPYQIVNRRHGRARALQVSDGTTATSPNADRLTGARTVNPPKKKNRTNALPCYVTPDQARAMIGAARTTSHRMLLECLWQSGGRITEVLRLRPCDLDVHEGALHMLNQKQRSEYTRSKTVYVSPALVGDLQRLAADNHIPSNGFLFRSQQHNGAISRQYAWLLINRYALAAGVVVQTPDGQSRPAHARDFRHGAAVNQIRAGVPLTEVAQQLGHSSIGSTAVYTRLASPERRAIADRVQW